MTTSCYYCGKPIEEDELVEKKIPIVQNHKKDMVRRTFHITCVPEIVSTRKDEKKSKKEDRDWDDCYVKFREVMGYDVSITLNSYSVMRLKGLRVGKFSPQGQNVKSLKRGYSYESIYKTILFCSQKIREAVSKTNFKNEEHKINYVMTIIVNNIDFINKKLETQKIAENHLNNMEKNEPESTFNHSDHEWKVKGQIDKYKHIEEVVNKKHETYIDNILKENGSDIDWDELF